MVNPSSLGGFDGEGLQVNEAADDAPLGWFSPTYELRQPARLVRVSRARSARGLEIETLVSPARAEPA
jgi:hypothetical protein